VGTQPLGVLAQSGSQLLSQPGVLHPAGLPGYFSHAVASGLPMHPTSGQTLGLHGGPLSPSGPPETLGF
jgi:hypothetical protein